MKTRFAIAQLTAADSGACYVRDLAPFSRLADRIVYCEAAPRFAQRAARIAGPEWSAGDVASVAESRAKLCARKRVECRQLAASGFTLSDLASRARAFALRCGDGPESRDAFASSFQRESRAQALRGWRAAGCGQWGGLPRLAVAAA